MGVLNFNDWKKEKGINEEVDVNQNIKDLELDRTDAQAIISKIDALKSITTVEQLDQTKETTVNLYQTKKGSATVAALTLLELEAQHRAYQIKTEEARKKFTETMTELDTTIKSIKDKSANLNQ